jgi:hypothetical protein
MNNHYKKLMRKAFHLILGSIGFFLFVTLMYVIAVSGKKPVKAGVDIVKDIEGQNVPALLQAIRQKDVTEIDVTVPYTEEPLYSVPEKTTEEITTQAPLPVITEEDVTEPADEPATKEPGELPTEPPTQAPTVPIPTEPSLTVKQIKIMDFQKEWNEKLDLNDVRNLSNEEQQQIHAMFMNTIFFGDSMTQAIGDYGFIDMSQVIYKRSASVDALIEKIPEVAAVYPERVVIFVGLNNCNFYKTPEDFATAFTALVQKLREQIPGVTLYVSSLLPPSDVLGSTRADLVRAPMYDALLNHTANILGVNYIDSKWIVRQQNYLKDGIHMNRTFYRVWFRYLQLLMGPNL